MLKHCDDLVNDYIEWLRRKITVEDINGIYEITTPFLDRHNDYLQIYVKRENGSLIITDDGYTITDLRLGGCEINTKKRRHILDSILNGFGIQIDRDELFVNAKPNDFPQKKHNLIQAMLSVNDLFVLARPMVASLFKEDVEHYLHLNEIRFTPSVNFIGRSGFTHFFDFVIPASRAKPERILRTINRPNRQNTTSLMFSWDDTREVRAPDSTAYAVLNDMEYSANPDIVSALRQYDIKTLLWSERDKYVNELAA